MTRTVRLGSPGRGVARVHSPHASSGEPHAAAPRSASQREQELTRSCTDRHLSTRRAARGVLASPPTSSCAWRLRGNPRAGGRGLGAGPRNRPARNAGREAPFRTPHGNCGRRPTFFRGGFGLVVHAVSPWPRMSRSAIARPVPPCRDAGTRSTTGGGPRKIARMHSDPGSAGTGNAEHAPDVECAETRPGNDHDRRAPHPTTSNAGNPPARFRGRGTTETAGSDTGPTSGAEAGSGRDPSGPDAEEANRADVRRRAGQDVRSSPATRATSTGYHLRADLVDMGLTAPPPGRQSAADSVQARWRAQAGRHVACRYGATPGRAYGWRPERTTARPPRRRRRCRPRSRGPRDDRPRTDGSRRRGSSASRRGNDHSRKPDALRRGARHSHRPQPSSLASRTGVPASTATSSTHSTRRSGT